jgi:hypothetical protein
VSNHFRIECSCGAVIAQCRCPSPDKRIEVRASACPKCRDGAQPARGMSIVVAKADLQHIYPPPHALDEADRP